MPREEISILLSNKYNISLHSHQKHKAAHEPTIRDEISILLRNKYNIPLFAQHPQAEK